MTKKEFRNKFSKVTNRQLNSWLKKHWIRGAYQLDDGSIYIPEGAIPPYARRQTKCKGYGLYTSLLNGISRGLDVFPELYNIHPDRFKSCIDTLKQLGVIKEISIENIVYYEALPKCSEYLGKSHTKLQLAIKSILDCLSPVIEAGTTGVCKAILT